MPGNADTGKAIAVLFILGLGAWAYFSSSNDDGSKKVGANSPLMPIQIADRLKTLSYVGTVQLPTAENGNDFVVSVVAESMFDSGDKVESVLHTVHNHAGTTPYSGVSIDVSVKLVDGYGRTSEPPLFRLIYSKSDIDKINFDNIITYQMLNLAQVVSLKPDAGSIIADECQNDGDLVEYAKIFCVSAALASPPNSAQ